MGNILLWTALTLAVFASIGLILHRDWRWGIGFLALAYLVNFWFVQENWPFSMAIAKLVTGWMACAVLVLAQFSAHRAKDNPTIIPRGRLFHFFATGIVISVSFALTSRASSWLGLSLPISWGSMLLIGTGLLQLGISAQPFRIILGLLTVLAGFEIVYAAVENSILVAAMLSVVNLGLSLTGAFFLVLPGDAAS
jgi:hypothetical protein